MSTIHDVARLSDVSVKTVSRVLNDEANVSRNTRDKVLKAIDQLSYTPHQAARVMRSGKSNVIGLITGAISSTSKKPTDEGLPSVHILKGIQHVCRKTGKLLMLADSYGDQGEMGRVLSLFRAHRVDAVVYIADSHRQVAFPVSANSKVLLVNCFDALGTPCVLPDECTGQKNAVRSLYRLGHKHIAYLGLPEYMIASKLRSRSFLEAGLECGLTLNNMTVKFVNDFDDPASRTSSLWKPLEDLFSAENPPTAICFGNDQMAFFGKNILAGLGKNVPEDISIVGFDNDPQFVEMMTPSLASIELPYFRMGEKAMEFLLENLEDYPQADAPPCIVTGDYFPRDSVRSVN